MLMSTHERALSICETPGCYIFQTNVCAALQDSLSKVLSKPISNIIAQMACQWLMSILGAIACSILELRLHTTGPKGLYTIAK